MTRPLVLLIGLLALAAITADADAQEPAGPAASLTTAAREIERFNAASCWTAPGPFDVTEIGWRAFGRHWRDRTSAEIADFGGLVVRRLQRWYARLLEREGVPALGAVTATRVWATVSATTPVRGRTVVYRLHQVAPDGPWRVYDLETSGRGRIRAYYTEFDRIILSEGYRVLVSRLQAELDIEAPSEGRRECGATAARGR